MVHVRGGDNRTDVCGRRESGNAEKVEWVVEEQLPARCGPFQPSRVRMQPDRPRMQGGNGRVMKRPIAAKHQNGRHKKRSRAWHPK